MTAHAQKDGEMDIIEKMRSIPAAPAEQAASVIEAADAMAEAVRKRIAVHDQAIDAFHLGACSCWTEERAALTAYEKARKG